MDYSHKTSGNIFRHRRRVYIPRRLGRTNPRLIKTDHFNFAAIGNTIKNASQQIGKVAQEINNTAGVVQGAIQTVKGVQGALKQSSNGNTNFTPYPMYQQPYGAFQSSPSGIPLSLNMNMVYVGLAFIGIMVAIFAFRKSS